MTIIAFVLALISVACVVTALVKGRPVVNWALLGFLFFLLAWIWLHVRFDTNPYFIK